MFGTLTDAVLFQAPMFVHRGVRGFWGLGVAPIKENPMEKKMENEMDTGFVSSFIGIVIRMMILDSLYKYLLHLPAKPFISVNLKP